MTKGKVIQSVLVGLLLLLGLILGYFYHLAGKSIYYKYGFDYWQTQHPAACTPYRERYFKSLTPKSKLDFTCKEALSLTANSAFAKTDDGLSIHYRTFEGNTLAPILLHMSGITSDWLNGARYTKAAERMGFQLVTMEMRNHGNSDTNGLGVAYGCKEKLDILAVLKNLHIQYPDRSIYLWSTSGATMAVMNAAKELSALTYVKALVLENPISSLADVAKVKSPGLPSLVYSGFLNMASWRAGVDFQTCAPIHQVNQLKQPTLVTVSKKDDLTPVWMAKKIKEQLVMPQKQFKVYPKGLHERVWNGQPEVYEADLKAHWLKSQY